MDYENKLFIEILLRIISLILDIFIVTEMVIKITPSWYELHGI